MDAQHDPDVNEGLGVLIRERLQELRILSAELAGAASAEAIAEVVSRRGPRILGPGTVDLTLAGSATLEGCAVGQVEQGVLEIPVQVEGRSGALTLRRAEGDWSDDDRCLAELIAASAAAALEREELRAARQERATATLLVADASRRAQELVDVIGHELRNPLAAIGAAAAVLTHAASPGGPRHEARAREIITSQTRHLAGMIDDLIEVARAQQRQIVFEGERVDLARLVRDAADARRSAAQLAGIQLVVRGADAPVPAIAMPVRLTKAIAAVIDNAIRFGRRGGWVEVELREGSDRNAVAVRDDGIGMSRELLARAFEPLVQGVALRDRGPVNGLGLGLTLAREIAQLHGGDITARSDGLGRGSTVELELPRAPATDSRSAPARAPTARRILVVDDGEDTLEMMQELLGSWGHEVRVASTGTLAIEIARHHPPELVLCDLGLPGELDGYDVARVLRADPLVGAARLVAVTGYDGDAVRSRAQAAGFDELVTKPAHPDRLRGLIDALDRD